MKVDISLLKRTLLPKMFLRTLSSLASSTPLLPPLVLCLFQYLWFHLCHHIYFTFLFFPPSSCTVSFFCLSVYLVKKLRNQLVLSVCSCLHANTGCSVLFRGPEFLMRKYALHRDQYNVGNHRERLIFPAKQIAYYQKPLRTVMKSVYKKWHES